jgi:flagellar P-ring protein precursor FlgI
MNFSRSNSKVACRALVSWVAVLAVGLSALTPYAAALEPGSQALVRDITSVEGVRDNLLVGYGLVVGLHGTGDTQQTIFTVQTLANAMQKMGVLISPATVVVKNVAAVFITATLPPFARPGSKLDVTVGSAGDARSLDGGMLLMTALRAPDGKIYAEAQGPLVMGGYVSGNGFNAREISAANVGTVPQGGIVERDTAVDLSGFKTVSLLLHNPDFNTATAIADAVNRDFHKPIAVALDARRVDISVSGADAQSVPQLIARVQNLSLEVHTPAKIVINERTGTIVLGGNVRLSPVSVLHGTLSIEVVGPYGGLPGVPNRSAPPPGAGAPGGPPPPLPGPPTNMLAIDGPTQSMRLDAGANVEDLVTGLHAIGTTAHDVVSILEAIKAEGGMQADLEVQ